MLPPEVQAASGVLGFNQSSWDLGLETSSSNSFWSQLSVDEQAAAAGLFYDEASWNAEIFPMVTCRVVESWEWVDIPAELKPAAEALGYDENSWDTSDSAFWPSAAFLDWEDLTAEEKSGAQALGYSQFSWNNGC